MPESPLLHGGKREGILTSLYEHNPKPSLRKMTRGTHIVCSGRTASYLIFVRILQGSGGARGLRGRHWKKRSEVSLLLLFHLRKQIREEFSVTSGQQQSPMLQETTLQCVLATTVRFSFRSYYHPLQNSYKFKP